ncbi:MAG: cytochrome c [Magnetococcales bacterium]|nr:cytochrome c [Magnetococcales bacterium]
MKFFLSFLAVISILISTQNSFAADAVNGKELHDASCVTACHSSRVDGKSDDLYKRPNRRKSLAKLTMQVEFCNQQVLNSEWWPEDVSDVVEYLNTQFYHFAKTSK